MIQLVAAGVIAVRAQSCGTPTVWICVSLTKRPPPCRHMHVTRSLRKRADFLPNLWQPRSRFAAWKRTHQAVAQNVLAPPDDRDVAGDEDPC